MSFGCTTISNLIPRVAEGELTQTHMMKVLQLFLNVNNIKIRKQLAQGLSTAFEERHGHFLSQKTLGVLVGMNSLKIVADPVLDVDKSIETI